MNQTRPGAFGADVFLPPVEPEDSSIDLVAVARTLWRGKFWLGLFLSLGLGLAWYQAYVRSTPFYAATATLALEVEQGRLVSFEAVAQGLSGDDATIATELEVIRSRSLITKLVETYDLTAEPEFNPYLQEPSPPLWRQALAPVLTLAGLDARAPAPMPAPSESEMVEATVDTVIGSIGVEQRDWSYVVTISGYSRDPALAARLANGLADIYIRDRLEVKFEKTRQATEWLSERVAELQSEVESSAGELKTFLAGADLVSADVLSGTNLRLKEQRERLAETEAAARAATERAAGLAAARAAGDHAEMARLADDPALTRILPQAEAGQPTALRLFDARLEHLISQARDAEARSIEQISVLGRSVARLQNEIDTQSDELVRLEQLEREAEADRLIYEYFLTRLKETSVQEGIQQADARVISPAVIPYAPFAPNKRRMLAIGGLVGLVLGVGTLLFRERFVAAIRTPDELETLTGLPVLGQIPRVPARTRSGVAKYLLAKPASAAVEAVRSLRTSLLLSNLDAPPQVIMLTSAVPGEGKTTASFALAANYAALGKQVLMVEGDIRRRAFSDLIDTRKAPHGLTDVLNGVASLGDAAYRPDGLRFDVLVGNESTANPADVLSSRQFSTFVAEARLAYDVVIFDTPPLLVVSDARVIGQNADAILFTVLWNKTTRGQLEDALGQLTSVGLKVTGLVLQNIDPVGMRRLGHGNRYGAYNSGYGKTYYQN